MVRTIAALLICSLIFLALGFFGIIDLGLEIGKAFLFSFFLVTLVSFFGTLTMNSRRPLEFRKRRIRF